MIIFQKSRIIYRIKNSKLARDSFWAIFGNGLGNLLIMVSGILIARLLGKDLYGQYGVVKSTMFYIASFSCFGMGVTSTKYVSQALVEDKSQIHNIIRDCIKITFCFSFSLSSLLFVFANPLAEYLGEKSLAIPFKVLACIIIFRSLTTTQIGVLSGLKLFKTTAYNSMASGIFILVLCVPLTYYFSLKGSLFALLLSQIFNFLINRLSLKKELKKFEKLPRTSQIKEKLKFSLPVALQESSIWISNWVCILMLTKLSNPGELGLYTAATQWNAVISMIPVLLTNVILSYISSAINNEKQHSSIFKSIMAINLISTFVPFLFVFILANFISGLYGPTFSGLSILLRVITLTTLIDCCTNIFKSEFVARNKTWLFFLLRSIRDIVMIIIGFLLISYSPNYGALMFSYALIISSISFLFMQIFGYKIICRQS